MNLKICLNIVSCLLISATLQAQTFNAGIILGFNAAQLDGDNIAGYSKVGLQTGLRGTVALGEHYDMSIELLYSQKGSRNESIFGSANPPLPASINLSYVEVPVFFNYKDWLHESEEYYKMEFNFGLAYSSLINVSIEEFMYVEENFKNFDLSIIAGATFFATEHLGINFRYERSLLLIYKGDESQGLGALNGHHVTFQLLYML